MTSANPNASTMLALVVGENHIELDLCASTCDRFEFYAFRLNRRWSKANDNWLTTHKQALAVSAMCACKTHYGQPP